MRKRLLVLTLLSLAPVYAVIAYSEWSLLQSRRAEVHESALRSARQANSEMARVLGGVESTLVAVGTAPVVRQVGPECAEYLEAIRARVNFLSGIAIADATGKTLCPEAGIDLSDRSYWQEALRSDRAVVGEYSIGRRSKRPILPVALALRDEKSTEPPLVIVGSVSLDWLGARLRERGVPEGGSLTVADRNGVILAREPSSAQFVGTRIPEPYMALVKAKKEGVIELTSQDGTARALGYIPITGEPEGIYVSAGLSSEVSYAAVQGATRISVLIALAGSVAALLLAGLVGRSIFERPLRRLIDIAEEWRRGSRSARSALKSAGELGQLSAALDRMMDEIERNQRERTVLIEELKHRGKNMLATVQAMASASFDNGRPAREALPNFFARVAALSRSQDALVNGAAPGDLAGVIDDVVRPLCGATAGKCIIDGPRVQISARQVQAVTMIVHELCTNAIKYGALSCDEGSVRVTWRTDGDAGSEVRLRWEETGGPDVQPPERRGFGTRLIRGFGQELGAVSLEYPKSGAVCEIRIRQPGLEAEREIAA